MAHKAIEAIKVKTANGTEKVFEPNTDMTLVATGELVETSKSVDDSTGLETVVEAGTDTTPAAP